MPPFSYAPETLHIALVSLPQHDVDKYADSLIKNFYNVYKRDITRYSSGKSKSEPHLYSPLKYYIFGNYDIALISLINNYKFAQKQISPKTIGNSSLFFD